MQSKKFEHLEPDSSSMQSQIFLCYKGHAQSLMTGLDLDSDGNPPKESVELGNRLKKVLSKEDTSACNTLPWWGRSYVVKKNTQSELEQLYGFKKSFDDTDVRKGLYKYAFVKETDPLKGNINRAQKIVNLSFLLDGAASSEGDVGSNKSKYALPISKDLSRTPFDWDAPKVGPCCDTVERPKAVNKGKPKKQKKSSFFCFG